MQIPIDQPLMGPVQFHEGNVPQVFVQVPQQFSYLIPRATAALLNRSTEMAQNNLGRLAAFNGLVMNNFQNPHLSEWVLITIRLALLKAMKAGNISTVDGYLNEASGEAASYFSSILTMNTPAIYSRCNPQVQQSASYNVGIFQTLKPELFGFDMNSLGTAVQNYSNNYASAHQNNAPQTTWSQQPQQQTQFPQHQQSNWNHSQPQQPQSTWGQAPAPQAPQPVQTNNSSWGSSTAPNGDNTLKQAQWFNEAQATQNSATYKSGAEIFSTIDQVAEIPVTSVTPPTQVAQPMTDSAQISITPLKTTTAQGGHEMDLNTHAVPYFGASELLDLSNRRMDLKVDALQISKEGRRNEHASGPIMLNTNMGLEVSRDTAIFMTRAALREAKNKEPVTLFRQFHAVLHPTMCSETVKGLMAILTSDTYYVDLPIKFQHFVKSFRDPSNPTLEEQEALNFLAYLDRKLTDVFNNFLKRNLRVDRVRMSSFSEGIQELRELLNNKLGTKYAQAMDAWASRFLDSLRENYSVEAEAFLSEYIQDGSGAVGYFPVPISVTLMELTAKELAYDVADEGTAIDQKVTNVLYDLAAGLHRNKKDLGVFTAEDILVTADDVRYLLTEDALEPGKFLIYRL